MGYDRVPLDQIIGARMFGVSIGFVKEVWLLGVRGASLDKLISMRMFSVTPAFVRESAVQGYRVPLNRRTYRHAYEQRDA